MGQSACTCTSAGYEPKRLQALRMMDRRRRATREELAQGEEEMKQAEARLRAEAAASNEEAIEDRKSEPKQEEAGKSGDQTNGPVGSIEDKREDPMKNSPNVEDTPKPARSHPPTTPPPSYPPVQDVRSAGLKTPERQEGGEEQMNAKKVSAFRRQRRTGLGLWDRTNTTVHRRTGSSTSQSA